MSFFKRGLPLTLAILFGLSVLVGMLALPPLADMLLNWAAFVAAAALILGILNLLAVHLGRARGGNGYSVLLVLSMLAMFTLTITDTMGLTDNSVEAVFNQLQAPLEAALASLVAFFLLFAGVRLLQRRNIWSVLLLLSALFFLITQAPLPAAIGDLLSPIRTLADTVLVTAGVRGLLLGVALGILLLSLRLLSGLERPYSS
jgi:hypothetical protein